MTGRSQNALENPEACATGVPSTGKAQFAQPTTADSLSYSLIVLEQVARAICDVAEEGAVADWEVYKPDAEAALEACSYAELVAALKEIKRLAAGEVPRTQRMTDVFMTAGAALAKIGGDV